MNRDASPHSNGDLDQHMVERDVADLICQSVRTLQKWRQTGGGPQFFKFGSSVRYQRRDVVEWIEARRKGHTSQ